MTTILLATNGSGYAQRAAEHAIDLAREREATLHVLCVVDQQKFDEPALSSGELATMEAEDYGHNCVAEVVEQAERAGVPVEGVTRHGVPHETILAYADEVDADVLVLGERGDYDKHFAGVGRDVVTGTDREVVVVDDE
ncbi:MAG: universal stress protein [Haloarculaceae archaeon]